jgi:hypothetical protein
MQAGPSKAQYNHNKNVEEETIELGLSKAQVGKERGQ